MKKNYPWFEMNERVTKRTWLFYIYINIYIYYFCCIWAGGAQSSCKGTEGTYLSFKSHMSYVTDHLVMSPHTIIKIAVNFT